MTAGDRPGRAPTVCASCGRTDPAAVPLGWSNEPTERGVRTLCAECTRANVRSIEAKLGSEWW